MFFRVGKNRAARASGRDAGKDCSDTRCPLPGRASARAASETFRSCVVFLQGSSSTSAQRRAKRHRQQSASYATQQQITRAAHLSRRATRLFWRLFRLVATARSTYTSSQPEHFPIITFGHSGAGGLIWLKRQRSRGPAPEATSRRRGGAERTVSPF